MSFWHGVATIVAKDVLTELRSKQMLGAMFVFALMTAVIFNFAFELRVENARQIVPGVLWVAFTFAGVLGLNRSFVLEQEDGCIEGLMLAPVDRSVIYTGKLLSNVAFMTVAEALVAPVFVIMFDISILSPVLWVVILLGTIGFAAVGTLFAAIAVNTRARDIMLPILLFPAAVPVLIAATRSTAQILNGLPLSELQTWLRLLLAFDIIAVVTAFLSFEYVIEE